MTKALVTAGNTIVMKGQVKGQNTILTPRLYYFLLIAQRVTRKGSHRVGYVLKHDKLVSNDWANNHKNKFSEGGKRWKRKILM